MNWDRLIEVAILLTLWAEFWYDAWWNSRENQRKRRKKQQPNFENLTTGEGK